MAESLEFDLTLYPSPVLRKVASPIEAFDDGVKGIVAGMFERMYEQRRRAGRSASGSEAGSGLQQTGDPEQKDEEVA